MAPFTSSAINKSGKSFAPRAGARRRPATKAAPSTAAESALDTSTVGQENDTDARPSGDSTDVPHPQEAPVRSGNDISDSHILPSEQLQSQPEESEHSNDDALAGASQERTPTQSEQASTLPPRRNEESTSHPQLQEAHPSERSIQDANITALQSQTEKTTQLSAQSEVNDEDTLFIDPALEDGNATTVGQDQESRASRRRASRQIAGTKRKAGHPTSKARRMGHLQPIEENEVSTRVAAEQSASDADESRSLRPSKTRRTRATPRRVMESVEVPASNGTAAASRVDDVPENDGHDNSDYAQGGAAEQEEVEAPIKNKKRKSVRKVKNSKLSAAPSDNNSQNDANGVDGDAAGGTDDELHEIDPGVVTLSQLTKDRGLGKTSEREKRMQKIDWADVKRRQREEGSTARDASQTADGENSRETPAGPPTQPVSTGVQLRLVNGEMVVDETTTQIDRQAQAVADAENMKVIDDADLTNRTNRMSWINDKRRDEADRVPVFKMKSDPWSDAETDRFYEALGTWGTDFMMISKMFPPKTRRQIKLKFVREERLDLARVNSALMGKGVPMTIESFAQASGLSLEDFKDPTIVDRELREEHAKSQVEIEQKRAEAAEAQAQRAIQMESRDREREQREEQKRIQSEQRAAERARKRGRAVGGGAGMF